LRQEIEQQAFRCSITHFFITEDEVSPERSRVFRESGCLSGLSVDKASSEAAAFR
jgi:hypothetical protein